MINSSFEIGGKECPLCDDGKKHKNLNAHLRQSHLWVEFAAAVESVHQTKQWWGQSSRKKYGWKTQTAGETGEGEGRWCWFCTKPQWVEMDHQGSNVLNEAFLDDKKRHRGKECRESGNGGSPLGGEHVCNGEGNATDEEETRSARWIQKGFWRNHVGPWYVGLEDGFGMLRVKAGSMDPKKQQEEKEEAFLDDEGAGEGNRQGEWGKSVTWTRNFWNKPSGAGEVLVPAIPENADLVMEEDGRILNVPMTVEARNKLTSRILVLATPDEELEEDLVMEEDQHVQEVAVVTEVVGEEHAVPVGDGT
jgi:hypothetical protein